MGCVHSKRDVNDVHPNLFEVTNVDEMGHLVNPGQLELTETELILYQKGKTATRWPLRSLRKYGFDSEIFSFECGRRCPTGAGIYAFRCRKAEQLFNLLQQNIQLRNINNENNPPVSMYVNFMNQSANINAVSTDFPTPVSSTGLSVTRRTPSQSQAEGYLNPTPAPLTIRTRPSLSRPGSITSNGPVSPVSPAAMSPPPNINCDIFLEHNNNKQNNLVAREQKHSYSNTRALDTANVMSPSYINLNATTPPVAGENYMNVCSEEQTSRLYMNVSANDTTSLNFLDNLYTKDLPNTTDSTEIGNSIGIPNKPTGSETEEPKHCYANIDAADLESLRMSNPNSEAIPLLPPSTPQTPTYITVQEVNYAELDLVPSKSELPNTQSTPDSLNKVGKSYVTIDFKKTTALSQSVNPSVEVEEGIRKTRHNSNISEVEEGIRKTRHNSNISDVTTRHSNSLSD